MNYETLEFKQAIYFRKQLENDDRQLMFLEQQITIR